MLRGQLTHQIGTWWRHDMEFLHFRPFVRGIHPSPVGLVTGGFSPRPSNLELWDISTDPEQAVGQTIQLPVICNNKMHITGALVAIWCVFPEGLWGQHGAHLGPIGPMLAQWILLSWLFPVVLRISLCQDYFSGTCVCVCGVCALHENSLKLCTNVQFFLLEISC